LGHVARNLRKNHGHVSRSNRRNRLYKLGANADVKPVRRDYPSSRHALPGHGHGARRPCHLGGRKTVPASLARRSSEGQGGCCEEIALCAYVLPWAQAQSTRTKVVWLVTLMLFACMRAEAIIRIVENFRSSIASTVVGCEIMRVACPNRYTHQNVPTLEELSKNALGDH